MKIILRAAVAAKNTRVPGYEADVLAAAKEYDDNRIWLSESAYANLRKKYSPDAKPAAKAEPNGPGSQLKALLAKFGIHSSPTCKCNSMARKMDAWGPDESLNHLEEIVDVMEETAQKRGLPFIRTAARLLVRRAISKSRALIRRETK